MNLLIMLALVVLVVVLALRSKSTDRRYDAMWLLLCVYFLIEVLAYGPVARAVVSEAASQGRASPDFVAGVTSFLGAIASIRIIEVALLIGIFVLAPSRRRSESRLEWNGDDRAPTGE